MTLQLQENIKSCKICFCDEHYWAKHASARIWLQDLRNGKLVWNCNTMIYCASLWWSAMWRRVQSLMLSRLSAVASCCNQHARGCPDSWAPWKIAEDAQKSTDLYTFRTEIFTRKQMHANLCWSADHLPYSIVKPQCCTYTNRRIFWHVRSWICGGLQQRKAVSKPVLFLNFSVRNLAQRHRVKLQSGQIYANASVCISLTLNISANLYECVVWYVYDMLSACKNAVTYIHVLCTTLILHERLFSVSVISHYLLPCSPCCDTC